MNSTIDMDSLTPEQRAGILELVDGRRAPHERRVTVDGVELTVDMRRVSDYRTLSLIAAVEGGDTFAAVKLFDFILGDERDRCVEELSDADGYCDAARFTSFCARVLEEVGAKN